MTMPHLMNCLHRDDSWCLDCVKAEWERTQAEIEQLTHERNEIERKAIEQSEHVQHDWAAPAVVTGMKAEIARLQAIVDRSTAVTEDGVRVVTNDHVYWRHGGWTVVGWSELGTKLNRRYSTLEAASKARKTNG